MDLYHIWCNLKPGVSDTDFADKAMDYFQHLEAEGLIAGHRIMRRKLGLGPPTGRPARFVGTLPSDETNGDG